MALGFQFWSGDGASLVGELIGDWRGRIGNVDDALGILVRTKTGDFVVYMDGARRWRCMPKP